MSDTFTIEVIPAQEAVARGRKIEMDAIIRLAVPEAEQSDKRTPVNIGLVIDRSGSMQGTKLEWAIKAAEFAFDQLRSTDRVSVVAYDDSVQTVLKATHPTNKSRIKRALRQIRSGGRTALHAGWIQGGIEVSEALQKDTTNRIILLSDGQANVGETRPQVIEEQARGLVERGVSTSTIGVGQDYNEDLMAAIARGGSGYYWFIDSPEQLPAIFRQELNGLAAVVAKDVELTMAPCEGTSLVKIYNELETAGDRTWRLSDLQAGQTVDILVRLDTECDEKSGPICEVGVRWVDTESQAENHVTSSLKLKVVEKAELSDYPTNAEVLEQVALFRSAALKQNAVEMVDGGDLKGARRLLRTARAELEQLGDSSLAKVEMAAIEQLEQLLEAHDYSLYRKSSHYQSFSHSHGHYHSHLLWRLGGGPVRGDITQPCQPLAGPVEAIVNSPDNRLSNYGFLSRAIHEAAGPELLLECSRIGWCDFGDAKITKGYNLPVDWVIHTVCPPWMDGQENEVALRLLRSCYLSVLRLARENGIRSLAIPAIGAGAMGFPLHLAAETAIETVVAHLTRSPVPAAVLFVCYDDTTLQVYQKAFSQLVAGA